MRLLTASKAALASQCTYWLSEHVPHDLLRGGHVLAAAQEGTLLHAAFDACLWGDAPSPPGRPSTPEQWGPDAQRRVAAKFAAWRTWVGTHRRVGWQCEVALAYDPERDEGRRLAPAAHRDYSGVQPGEVAGTFDVLAVGEDVDGAYAEVLDYKTGVRSPAARSQLALGALAWCRVLRLPRARMRAVYVGEEGVTEDVWEHEAGDLDATRETMRRIVRGPSEPRVGEHCQSFYCPARAACPGVAAEGDHLTGLPAGTFRALGLVETAEQAARAYVTLRLAAEALERVRERVRALVERDGSVPLDASRELRMVTSVSERFSKERCDPETLVRLRELGALARTESTSVRVVNTCRQ